MSDSASQPEEPPTAPGPLIRKLRSGAAPASALNPPRCLKCGYVLQGLDGIHACPECGAFFDLAAPSTYTTLPPYIASRYWTPVVGLACIFVLLSVPVMAYGFSAWGSSLFLMLPAAGGAFIGYCTPSGKVTAILSAVFVGLAFLIGIAAAGLGGVFCLLTLAGIVVGPILIGMGCGVGLRRALKALRYDQSGYLPLLLIAAVPYLCIPLEKWTTPTPAPETVSTSIIINASADECWDGLVFYEEVTHPPPWILRIGLARPLATRGEGGHNPGDRRVCVYNKGTITKQVRRAEPGRVLSFDVIEQNIGYERDLRLTSGSFTFEPIDADHTRITLTSTYEPKLTPRFCWRWGEQIAFRTLHGYVLEGIALNAQQPDLPEPAAPSVAARDAP